MYVAEHKSTFLDSAKNWSRCIDCLIHFTYKGEIVLSDGPIQKLVQACLRAPHVVADEAKLAIVFTYFFLSFSFYAFCFSPTSGNLPCVKICFPQYFGITRRYMQKKYIFLGNFFSPQKKSSFSRDFSRRPAFGRGAWTNP